MVNTFVQIRKRFTFGFLFGLQNSHIVEAEPLKTGILN